LNEYLCRTSVDARLFPLLFLFDVLKSATANLYLPSDGPKVGGSSLWVVVFRRDSGIPGRE
jgi:hypothetical protein